MHSGTGCFQLVRQRRPPHRLDWGSRVKPYAPVIWDERDTGGNLEGAVAQLPLPDLAGALLMVPGWQRDMGGLDAATAWLREGCCDAPAVCYVSRQSLERGEVRDGPVDPPSDWTGMRLTEQPARGAEIQADVEVWMQLLGRSGSWS